MASSYDPEGAPPRDSERYEGRSDHKGYDRSSTGKYNPEELTPVDGAYKLEDINISNNAVVTAEEMFSIFLKSDAMIIDHSAINKDAIDVLLLGHKKVRTLFGSSDSIVVNLLHSHRTTISKGDPKAIQTMGAETFTLKRIAGMLGIIRLSTNKIGWRPTAFGSLILSTDPYIDKIIKLAMTPGVAITIDLMNHYNWGFDADNRITSPTRTTSPIKTVKDIIAILISASLAIDSLCLPSRGNPNGGEEQKDILMKSILAREIATQTKAKHLQIDNNECGHLVMRMLTTISIAKSNKEEALQKWFSATGIKRPSLQAITKRPFIKKEEGGPSFSFT